MNILAKNYEIIKEIGRGGAGSVYLAHDKKLDRQVAIKILDLDSSLDKSIVEEMEKRFEKEAKAIAKLVHPNIVDIYDFGQEDGKHFMVIELLNGESLAKQINKIKNLPIIDILNIALQLCSAVSYAHSHGVIHRDIKPANVMLIQDDRVKLTDFGIAQLNNDKLGLTQAGSILGSILYIPPEQLVDSHKVDKRADVYSLGVTLFQLFTGRLPFEGNSVAEVVTKILNQEIPTMRSFRADIPEALDRIILKAIKKEPDERYQNIDDFSSALKDIKEYITNNKNPDLLIKKQESIKPNSNISNNKNIKTSNDKEIKSININKSNTSSKSLFFLIPLILILAMIAFFAFSNKKDKLDNTKKNPVTKLSPKPPVIKPKQQNTKSTIIKKVPIYKTVIKTNPQIKPKPSVNKVVKPVFVKPVKVHPKPISNIPKPIIRKVVIAPKPIIKKVTSKPIIKSIQNKKSVGEGY